MKLFVQKIKDLQLPKQAHEGEDAAYDIVATTPPMIVGEFIERPLDGLKLYKRVVFIEYGTNLFIEPQQDNVRISFNLNEVEWSEIGIKYHTQLFPRSSISKNNLVLANSVGIIDPGFKGMIMARFKYIFQPENLFIIQEDVPRIYGIIDNNTIYQQNDKILQIMASPNIPIQFEMIDKLNESKRGSGGFGSSNK